ncbi:MATE family efflux transporter [Anaerolentibacter hominis]|uniref:MATE family efflux transporter n=1 Tax=Anaerolentibacter hominis TaxID=3079009 RepID=UPI0031B84BF1
MNNTENPMRSRPVFPLLMSMAVPPMVSMLIQSMYNIVDSIFVARLGEDALTAVSLAFPLQNLVLSVAVGLGVGLNALMARNLGARDQKEVDRAASHGMVLTAIHSIGFVLFGLLFIRPFFHMFTEDAGIFEMGCRYSYIVICLSFGSLFHITIEKIFQAVGNMVVPMILQAVGAVVNIILDPIMIFGLFGFPALGVTGAAVATIIGQLVACGLSVLLLVRHNHGIHIQLKGFRFEKRIVKSIYSVAIPSGLMTAMPSILIGALNGIVTVVSQSAVAVLGVYFKLQTFVYMPANGVVQGMRPIVSYNYGAGEEKRLYHTLRAAFLSILVIMTAGTALFLFLTVPILRLFDAGESMRAIGIPALRIISLGFPVSAVGIVLSGAFEALGRGGESLVISLLRQLLIIIPLSAAAVKITGLTGVWVSFPVAETAAALAGTLLFLRFKKKLNIRRAE